MYDFVQSWLNNWDESHSGRKLWNHVIAWRSSVHFQETRVAWSDITCMQSLNMELQHRSNLRLEVTWSDHSKALWTINLYKLHQPHCDVEMMLSTGGIILQMARFQAHCLSGIMKEQIRTVARSWSQIPFHMFFVKHHKRAPISNINFVGGVHWYQIRAIPIFVPKNMVLSSVQNGVNHYPMGDSSDL